MDAESFGQEPAAKSPRLVAQPDGYADYVDQTRVSGSPRPDGQHRYSPERRIFPSRPGYAGRRRSDQDRRQRSIRSTITVLLVIPLLSLIGLWVYAASGTVGGAMAERHANQVNTDVGGPIQLLLQQLATERSDTYVWQSAHGRLPPATLLAQRPRTDAAIAAFKVGVAAASGVEPAADRPLAATLLAELARLPLIRAEVDASTLAPLTAFQDYNRVAEAIYPFASALNNPAAPIQIYQEGQSALDEGKAADKIGQEATLVGGALASGGHMPASVLRLFAQTVDDQRLLEQLGNSPLDWQASPDPYPRVFGSSAFMGFSQLEDKIVASQPGKVLPVSPAAWQASVEVVLAQFTTAQTTARLGVTSGDAHASDMVLLRLVLVGGAGLAAVVVSSLLLLRFGNRISRELTGLRGAARALASERLPSVVSRLRAGEEVDVTAEAPPLDLRTKTKEVTETADAFSAVQRTAVEAAVEQARLRKGVSLVFRSLARRNQTLVQRQLRMLDEMERGTDDPEALERLFRLDHLTTRMRRQAEGLIILSGAAPGRGWRQPVPVIEVLRGALGEIEDFARVDLITDSPDFLQGGGVADVTHLLAELIENAVLYSPPATRVQVRCGRVANGYVIEIEDRGLGIPEDTMAELNQRLARPPEFDLADSDRLGLFVVSRLAARQQIKVSLRTSGYGGTLAVALLPHSLVVSEEETVFLAAAEARGVPAGALAGRAQSPLPPARAGLAARATPEPGGAPLERRTAAPLGPRTAAASEPRAGGTSAKATSASAGSSGLPRRAPMTNMAPQLRESRQQTPKGPLSGRSPEQARALLSSIRQGWRTGLADAGGTDGLPGLETGQDRDEQ
jgi:signal transduction histidine kinase